MFVLLVTKVEVFITVQTIGSNMGAGESKRSDVPPQLQISEARVKRIFDAELRKKQNEAIIAVQRELQEEAASIDAQRKLQEEAFSTAQRELQEEAATLGAQRKLQEETFIATQRKLQEEFLIAAQRTFQEEFFFNAQRKLKEEVAVSVQSRLHEEVAMRALQDKLTKREYQEELAKRALQEEATKKKQQEEAAKRKQQEEAAKRAFQEELAKRALQEEAAKRELQEEAAKKKQQEEAAKRKQQEEAAKRKQQEEAAKRAFQEELAKRALQEEAAKRKLQEEAAKKKQQEEAAKRKQQEEAAKRAFQEELAKRALKEEAAKSKLQEEAAKKKQQEEAAKRKQQEEAAKRKQQEAAAKRAFQEELAKRALQEEAAKKKLQEKAAKKKQQEEAAKRAFEEEATKNKQQEAARRPFQEAANTSHCKAPIPVLHRAPFPRSRPVSRFHELPREDDIFCVTCYRKTVMTMFKCQKGHSSCIYCKNIGRTCGVCRSNLTNWRTYDVENQFAQSYVPCPHAWQGCVLHMKIADMKNHVEECPFKEQVCPLAAFENCRWFGEISELCSHFADMHPNFLYTKVDSEFRVANIHRNHRYICLVKLDYHFIFHQKISKNDRKIYMAVQLIGTEMSAMKWLYEIHVYNKSENRRKYVYTDNCRSSSDDMDDVFKSGDCAVLPLWYANTFVNYGALTYKFFIKRIYEGRRGFDRNQRGRDYSEVEEEDNGCNGYWLGERDIHQQRQGWVNSRRGRGNCFKTTFSNEY